MKLHRTSRSAPWAAIVLIPILAYAISYPFVMKRGGPLSGSRVRGFESSGAIPANVARFYVPAAWLEAKLFRRDVQLFAVQREARGTDMTEVKPIFVANP